MERFMQEVKMEFSELESVNDPKEMERMLKKTYRKAKTEGDQALYTRALTAYNQLLHLNQEI